MTAPVTIHDDNLDRIGEIGEVWAVRYSGGWSVYAMPAHRYGLVAGGLTGRGARALIASLIAERKNT
jgi:hypothetical protein